MSIKGLFEKKKEGSGFSKNVVTSSAAGFNVDVESDDLVKAYQNNKNEFLPNLDFNEPENFAKYGSAKDYYADAIKRIYNQYPYDGSFASKLTFYNNLTPLEKYIFDNDYPKTNGYVKFNQPAQDTYTGTEASSFKNSSTQEYIYFYGWSSKKSSVTGSFNALDVSKKRENALSIDFASGSTVEWWMNIEAYGGSTRQVIYDVRDSEDYRQLVIFITSAGKVNYAALTGDGAGTWTSRIEQSLDTGISAFAADGWHHYAVVQSTSSLGFKVDLYVDGTKTATYDPGHVAGFNSIDNVTNLTGSLKGTIGALGGAYGTAGAAGWGKLSGSIDEFRFWKVARTPKQIGRNYFTPVGGAANTDEANKDLGVYFKFNEGILGDDDKDNLVLDYSGRVCNGTFTGYLGSANMRYTDSGIVLSEVVTKEEKDPIIYSDHSDVSSLNSEKATSGSVHDAQNNSLLINSMPNWIKEEDETSEDLKKLLQIIGSYFDTIYGQVGEITSVREPTYPVSGSKPFPYSHRLLTSLGFDAPDVFVNSSVINAILSRDDKRTYEDKLFNIKNLIYKNIYNNLAYINKSKGTEKAFRNLIRCFGVDDDVVNLNIYGQNVEYEFRDSFRATQAKRKAIDFSGISQDNRSAIVYQIGNTTTDDYGFISSSLNPYIPLTIEAEVILPKFDHLTQSLGTLTTASLFGCNRSTGDHEEASFNPTQNRDFRVYTVKLNDDLAYFRMTSSFFGVDLTSSIFPSTSSYGGKLYDNSKWNLAVRFRPREYPFSSVVTASHIGNIEFYGVSAQAGEIVNEFLATASVANQDSYGPFMTSSYKRFYIGAERTDFSGSVVNPSDAKFLDFAVWADYLTNDEIKAHAKDSNNFGRTNPYENAFTFISGAAAPVALNQSFAPFGQEYIPRIDTLALHWDFSNITGSDALGGFAVSDVTSGSTDLSNALSGRYLGDDFSTLVKSHHTATGSFFEASADAYTLEFVTTARQQLPENTYSSDMIKVLSRDDRALPSKGFIRPKKHFFAVEMSMYDVISQNMLDFFATINDFNNQVGELSYAYRSKYKGLEKLRNLFFARVENIPDLDKFINLYKWIDAALDSIIMNLMPASVNAASQARSIIENHILERNKYRHKFPSLKTFRPVDNVQAGSSGGSADVALEVITTVADVPVAVSFSPSEIDGVPIKSGKWPKGSPYAKYLDNRPPIGADGILDIADESRGAYWWKHRARKDEHLNTANTSTNTTRTQIHLHLMSASGRTENENAGVFFDHVAVASPGAELSNQQVDHYKSTNKHSEVAKDGITLAFMTGSLSKRNENLPHITPLPSDQIQQLTTRPVKMVGFNRDNPEKTFKQSRLPFTVHSTSVTKGYMSNLSKTGPAHAAVAGSMFANVSIEDMHHDVYGPQYELSLQGPFTQEHVGGNEYRHGNLLVSGALERKEGYNIRIDPEKNSLVLSGPRIFSGSFNKDRPYGSYLRDIKRPINIRNIKKVTGSMGHQTSASIQGNYEKEYEIVSTNDRSVNNRYLTKAGSLQVNSTGSNKFYVLTGTAGPSQNVQEFGRLRRDLTGSNKHVIVSKFSAPGGAEVQSENFLDIESAQYSPYSAMPYRNFVVRKMLNTAWSRHAAWGGLDGFWGSPYASWQKMQRNDLAKVTGAAGPCRPGDTDCGVQPNPDLVKHSRDNAFVAHAIPRTDLQYTWIKNAWVGRINSDLTVSESAGGTGGITDLSSISSSAYLPVLGHSGSYALTLMSASELGSFMSGAREDGALVRQYGNYNNAIGPGSAVLDHPLDFLGLNFYIYEQISGSLNLLGYPLAGEPDSTRPTASWYVNVPGSDYATASFPMLSPTTASNLAGDMVSHLGQSAPTLSPDGEMAYVLNFILTNRNGPYGWPSWKQIRSGEHPVARFHKKNNIYEVLDRTYDPGSQTIGEKRFRIVQAPVTSKHKPVIQVYPDHALVYEFGNNLHYYADTYNTASNIVVENADRWGVQQDYSKTIFYRQKDTPWTVIKHSEVVFPKDENTYRDLIRLRKAYQSEWRDALENLGFYKSWIYGNQRTTQHVNKNWSNSIGSPSVAATNFGVTSSQGAIFGHKLNALGTAAGVATLGTSLGTGTKFLTSRASTWPMDVVSASEESWTDDAGFDDVNFAHERSGELMRVDTTSMEHFFGFSHHYDSSSAKYGRNFTPCRPQNDVHRQAGRGAFYESYEKYAKDIKVIGQDYSLMAEFTITDYVREALIAQKSDFYADIYDFAFTGSAVTSSLKKEFIETYASTDFMPHFSFLKNNLGEPDGIEITVRGIKKLLPKEGFYPIQRTVQLATEFSRSYSEDNSMNKETGVITASAGTVTSGAMWQTVLRPFYAPGIMYNTIKSGIGIDYPIIDRETIMSGITSPFNAAGEPAMHCSASYLKRMPFEAIVEPFNYAQKLVGGGFTTTGADPSGAPGATDFNGIYLQLYDMDPELELNSTGAIRPTDGVYERHAHNFFAETPNFFLENGVTTFKSKPNEKWIFEGPLSASAGIKHFDMHVWMFKTSDFFMHQAPHYFGHWPYMHHLPPYYGGQDGIRCTQQDTTTFPCSPGSRGLALTASAAHLEGGCYVHIDFDPTKIANEDPVKFNEGQFTLDDIIANSTVNYYQMNMENFSENSSSIAMHLTGCVNLYQKGEDNEWIISPKFETPILNFFNATTSSLSANPNSGSFRGMWHQYGNIPTGSDGIYMYVKDRDKDYSDLQLTGSLMEAVGFKEGWKRLGQIKNQKIIHEAVVAIPYYTDIITSEEKKFQIPMVEFEKSYQNVVAGNIVTSVDDMIGKMYDEKYVFPPDYDFVKIRKKSKKVLKKPVEFKPAVAPFAMYIFEFSEQLSQQDLADIWQGVMPSIAQTAKKHDVTIKHPIGPGTGEFFCETMLKYNNLQAIPENIRWRIFKVKQKAANNYFNMLDTFNNSRDRNAPHPKDYDFSANWPYDYFSLVELGKMEVDFVFNRELETSQTSINAGHSHTFNVDSDGNGTAHEKCSPESDMICHEHKIVNGAVMEAESRCYPNCMEQHGARGIGPHIHTLPGGASPAGGRGAPAGGGGAPAGGGGAASPAAGGGAPAGGGGAAPAGFEDAGGGMAGGGGY